MDSNKKATPAEAAQETTATSDIYNAITVVRSSGILTTTYRSGISVENSPAPDLVKTTDVEAHPVNSLDDVERIFDALFEDTHAAVILGRFAGDSRQVSTHGENFVDRRSNLITFDIGISTSLTDPRDVVVQLSKQLPRLFRGLDFLWTVKPRSDIKKVSQAYLTYWMPSPLSLAQVCDMVKKEGLKRFQEKTMPVPSRLVITAKPVFENGIVDTIPVRRGRCTGQADSGIHDKLTVVECLAPLVLTKTFHADGSVTPYPQPKNMKFQTAEITGWPDLIKLLQGLHDKPRKCLIRGRQTGNQSERKGTFLRRNENFSDQPLHWFMVDVDGFEPDFALPTDPAAVIEYIEAVLPPCFHKASYYWHMSSSAGQSPKLKCHLHFLSKTAYETREMHAWAKQVGKQVDSKVYQIIQCNYTADPIYEEGREDPVKVRAGFHQGEEDFVDLVITADARETGAGEGGHDMDVVDPSEKPGILGLFHRTYSAEEVLLELLDGEFSQVSERRYTWLNGGGTPEGVWVHERGMHVGSSHNTWPIDGLANLWDLVRIFKFGDLDRAEDEFDQLDIDSREIQAKPSHLAMLEWANGLEAIKEQAAEEAARHQAAATALLEKIAAAKSVPELTGPIAAEAKALLAEQTDLITKARIDSAIQAKAKKLDGANLPIAAVRALTQPVQPAKKGAMVVDAGDQLGMAKAVKNAVYKDGRRQRLAVRNSGSWFVFNGRCYKELPDDEAINNAVWQFLGKAMCKNEDGHLVPVKPTRGMVSGVVDALRSELALDIEAAPSWLPGSDGPDPDGLVVMANGILDISSGELIEHTPRLFAVNELTYDFDPGAECPQWLLFLDQVLPNDPESQQLLQEWFGYNLTADTSQQKFLMLIGQKRSGKGTVGRMLQHILGGGINAIGPTLSSLCKDFGLESWNGKLAAVIGDARSGGKEPQVVVERMLSITGEDTLTVERKHRSALCVKLPTRITIMSNEILRLGDASGALVGRMLALNFSQTFYGREDTQLEEKLRKELPGILNWALVGKRRLAERGRFVQPATGSELLQESHDINNPLGIFIREHCDLDPVFEEPQAKLFEAWQIHCRGDNSPAGTLVTFSKNMGAAFPELKKYRPRDSSGNQVNTYRGVRLNEAMRDRLNSFD